MKMYRDEKIQGFQRMILSMELFACVKHLIFFLDLYQSIGVIESNEKEKILNILFLLAVFCFKFMWYNYCSKIHLR